MKKQVDFFLKCEENLFRILKNNMGIGHIVYVKREEKRLPYFAGGSAETVVLCEFSCFLPSAPLPFSGRKKADFCRGKPVHL